jgi:hypothetical protein
VTHYARLIARVPPNPKRRRNWGALVLWTVLLSLCVYLLGLEVWELWVMILLIIYLGWCFRR